MMAAASSISFSSISTFTNYSLSKPQIKMPKFLQVRSQSLRDEGGSTNMVDANMNVLRARIEEVMRKEKFERTPKKMETLGWKYHEEKHKNYYTSMLMETMEFVGLVGGSLGLVFLLGSLPIFLVSFLVHFRT